MLNHTINIELEGYAFTIFYIIYHHQSNEEFYHWENWMLFSIDISLLLYISVIIKNMYNI